MASSDSAPGNIANTADQQAQRPSVKSSLPAKLVVGGFAGVIATSTVFPIDLVKTRLQSHVGPRPSFLQMFRNVLAAEGPAGMYRGLGANLVGVTPEKAIKLAVNDVAREYWTDANGKVALHHQVAAGALAGFCQVTATNPMEIVKIRLQMAATEAKAGEARPSAMQVVRHLGLSGMYRGAAATLMRDVPYSMVFFPTYANLRTALGEAWVHWRTGTNGPVHEDDLPLATTLFAGGFAGAFASGLLTPADVVKTKLQVRGGSKLYTGIFDCASKTYANGGMRSLFAGAGPRMMVQAPLFGIALLAFEVQKMMMKKWAAN